MTNKKKPAAALVITAAGSSCRMGGSGKKEFLTLPDGRTVLAAAAEPFFRALDIQAFVLTYCKNGADAAAQTKKALFASQFLEQTLTAGNHIPFFLTEGGNDRQESVCNALQRLREYGVPDTALVLIHDGARPFVTEKLIGDTVAAAGRWGAAVPAVPAVDTQKETDTEGRITRHLDRSRIAAVQTPQVFLFGPLFEAHLHAAQRPVRCTDDAEIWSLHGSAVYTVKGDPENSKITYPKDIQRRSKVIHTGFGYDLHRLVEGRRLMLGGVCIPFNKGESGHSDGDVLLHAITDALLGAAAAGDIGSFFPSSDPKWKDSDSAELLAQAWDYVRRLGWRIENLDCTVVLEKPVLLPYRDEVRMSIARILEADYDNIFVKAKTAEKLGSIGRSEAVQAWASCLISR